MFLCLMGRVADGLVSYSSAEGQLMMPPGYSIASLNDSIYDGTHHRRSASLSLSGLTPKPGP